jgi:hypothetical protein
MTRVDFGEVRLAQSELREALHGIDAIVTRRPTGDTALKTGDIDRILEYLEAAMKRLRTVRQSREADERKP